MSHEVPELIPTSSDLQTRLNMIIHTIPRFWQEKPYQHFTNHGLTYSQHVQKKLAQLALALPPQHRLSNDEIFIVSAAAWLYDIGMQSPILKPILDFDYRSGDFLTISHLQEIRAKKHLLTEQLILDSVRGIYKGPSLGLNHEDAYTR